MPTALGLADLSTLTLRVGTAACFPGRGNWRVSQGGYCIALLRSPEAAFKRTLMGVLEHPQPPPGYATGIGTARGFSLSISDTFQRIPAFHGRE